MSDQALNYFLGRGTTAQRTAFTPNPPTPAAGPPAHAVLWYDTDLDALYSWNGAAWELAALANAGVTNAKLADMAQATIKGRAAAAGTGAPSDLTANQTSTILDSATDPFLRSSVGALIDEGNSGTAKTVDLLGKYLGRHKVTLTGNVTFTLTNPATGGTYAFLLFTGAGSFTAAWPGNVKWPSSTTPVITTTAGRVDLITFIYDGTDYFGSINPNYTP